jgi:nucleoside-diphosphate-sugar epimerase
LAIADFTSPEVESDLRKAVEGVAGVYHIAALFREQGVPDKTFSVVNRDGVRRLIDAAVTAGVSRFIHCSTVGVLGHIAQPPADETAPYNPGDIYQCTKMEGEEIALQAIGGGLLSGAVIRPAMIYGPGDRRTLKLFRMIAKKRFFYVGRGEALVHWIDVRDLACAFRLAMEAGDRNGDVYILAGEQAVPLRAMCEEIANQLGVRPPWLQIPVKPMQWAGTLCEVCCRPFGIEPPLYRRRVDFFTKNRHFDGGKARRELGFSPSQSLAGEIRDIIASYRDNGLL